MKVFLISVAVLSIIIALSIANAFAVSSITSELLWSIDECDDGSINTAQTLELFDKYSFFLGLTIQNQKLERIREALLFLDQSILNNDQYAAQNALSLLRCLISKIREESTFSISNIL